MREGAQIGTTGCYCNAGYVPNGAGCVALSCSAYSGTGIADATTYTGAVAGKANDGVTDCRCPATTPVWNGSTWTAGCTAASDCGSTEYCNANSHTCLRLKCWSAPNFKAATFWVENEYGQWCIAGGGQIWVPGEVMSVCKNVWMPQAHTGYLDGQNLTSFIETRRANGVCGSDPGCSNGCYPQY